MYDANQINQIEVKNFLAILHLFEIPSYYAVRLTTPSNIGRHNVVNIWDIVACFKAAIRATICKMYTVIVNAGKAKPYRNLMMTIRTTVLVF